MVPGVTAREICNYFWAVQYRMDWEITVDQAPTVMEVCGDDTVVLHQVRLTNGTVVFSLSLSIGECQKYFVCVRVRVPVTFSVVPTGLADHATRIALLVAHTTGQHPVWKKRFHGENAPSFVFRRLVRYDSVECAAVIHYHHHHHLFNGR